MKEYSDVVIYNEENLELAYRDGHYEFNRSVINVNAKREFKEGYWRITSCQGCSVEDLMKLTPTSLNVSSADELIDADLYVGNVRLGEMLDRPTDLLLVSADVCSELGGNVARCEVVINIRNYVKSIRRDVGEANESKVIVEFIVGVVSKLGRIGYGGVYKAVIPKSSNVDVALIDKMVRTAYKRSLASCKCKALNPINVGRHPLILTPEVSAALIHEVSHLLEATSLNRLSLGFKLGPEDLHIYDNPYEPSSPTVRFFDDEGVSTIKRSLIENGRVVDYHHTRLTAGKLEGRAGSAYGIYHPPIPYHTTLTMKSGDWKEDEIVAETKRGFLIDGVVVAEVRDTYIRIVP
ncbi:MAG: metallopeptidase TldD-related protein, partial [Sulfolobales archaeon]